MKAKTNLMTAVFVTALFALNAHAATRYVRSDGNDSNNGTTWALAKKTINSAVSASAAGDEVVVTNGTYGVISTSNKSITIRSVNGADVTIIDGGGKNRCATLGSAGQTNTVLTGFTLYNGRAERINGGGAHGGTLNECDLYYNSAVFDLNFVNSGGHGGGAYGSRLNNCWLVGNGSGWYGGGASDCTLNNCFVLENFSVLRGGGVYNSTVNNSILAWNETAQGGGGSFDGTLNNCTVFENFAGTAGGGGGSNGGTLNNCIVWGNKDKNNAVNNYSGGTFRYSCTTPLPGGTGNITSDPLFLDAANGYFQLQSGSPCIDRGNNAYATGAFDLNGNPRIYGSTVDMGAFEYRVAMHDFVFFQPNGWGDSVFLSDSPNGKNLVTSFTHGQPIYLSYAYTDNNNMDFTGSMINRFRVTVNGETETLNVNCGNLPAGSYSYIDGYAWPSLQNLQPGTYTVTATLNDGDIVPESNYANNTRTLTFTVEGIAVTFNGNGGDPSSQVVLQALGGKYVLPASNPTRTGYTFTGWFTAASGGTPVTTATTVATNANHTLYAQWTANVYTIRFADLNLSPLFPDVTVTYGSAYGELPSPVRAGFTFLGWFTDWIQITDSTTVATASDHTLYARWIKNANGNWADVVNRDVTWPANWNASPLTISTEQELAQFAWHINQGTSFNGKTVLVTTELDMSAHYWAPAGNSTSRGFTGTFDGQNYTIQGLTINATNTLQYAGLFGYISSGGRIQNVNLVATEIMVYHASGETCVGSVVGCNSSDGTVENCSNSGTVIVTESSSAYVGGVVGHNSLVGTIANCSNGGAVVAITSSAYSCAGGVVGDNYGVIANCSNSGAVTASSVFHSYAGGTVGYNSPSGTIANSLNSGVVTAFTATTTISSSGGIAGVNDGTIANCTNSGAVTATSTTSSVCAGGVAGHNSSSGAIANCLNGGAVTATTTSSTSCAGGVVGDNYGTITNCLNSDVVAASSYVLDNYSYAGGVVGHNGGGTIANCYWKKDGTAGFNDNAIGTGSGATSNLISYDVAPGTLTATHPDYGTDSLLEVLNAWVVVTNTALGNIAYWNWKVEAGVNDGYPFLAVPTPVTTFDVNDGTPPTQTVSQTLYGTYTLPSSDPMRTGYTFVGWFTEATNGTQVTSSAIVATTSDHTLYAHWSPVAYAITYANTKGAANTNPSTYTIENAVTFAALPDVAGYTFAGWDIAQIAVGSTGTKTITAQWTPVAYAITYANTKGAANTNPSTYTIEDAVTFAALPDVAGYTFAGWDIAQIAVGSTGAKTITAQWTPVAYAITYANTRGAANSNPSTYTIEDAVAFAALPNVNGYTFAGWDIAQIAVGSTGTKTITAQWTPMVYALTYADTKGAANTNPATYTIENAVIFAALPDVAGYTFAGWDIAQIAVGSTGAKTITAQWTPVAYVITYADTKGAANTNPSTYTIEDSVTFAVLPDVAGYTFAGWDIAQIAVGSTGAKTVTAQWAVTFSLGESVNASHLEWRTGGGAEWFAQTAESYDGHHAARSGAIGDDDESWIETTVNGPGTLSFWWKVSSEAQTDCLYFLVDDLVAVEPLSGWKPNSSFWTQETLVLDAGAHTIRWCYIKDGSVSKGEDCGWLDEVVWVPDAVPLALGEAVNAPKLNWQTGGDADWSPQTAESHDGQHAARSGAIGDNESTWIEATVSGSGTLSFWWRVSSEGGSDFFTFLIDGQRQGVTSISGTKTGWLEESAITISGDGPHTLRWCYSKDFSVATGDDCGWLDEVVWVPDAVPLTLGEAVNAPQLDWQTGGAGDWFPQTDEFHDGLHAARSGAIGDNESTWIETTVSGSGTLSFWWRVSSEGGSDFFTFLIDGQEEGTSISGTKNGWLEESAITISGDGPHTLRWCYSKDFSVATGEDCGWLDGVTWVPAGINATTTTPRPVPHAWLDEKFPGNNGAYEDIANSVYGVYAVWESYVIGFEDPTDTGNRFAADIAIVDGKPVITWDPDLDDERAYILLGKPTLDTADWVELDPDDIDAGMRFFKVEVRLP